MLFRLNFLAIILCFTMNRMYQFYAFVPLVTFWYICCYVLMIVYPRLSARSAKENGYHYFYMIIKLGILFGFAALLNVSEVGLLASIALVSSIPLFNVFRLFVSVEA